MIPCFTGNRASVCVCVCVCVCVSQVATQPDNELLEIQQMLRKNAMEKRLFQRRLATLERISATRYVQRTTAVTSPAEFYDLVTKENHKRWFIEVHGAVDLKSTDFAETFLRSEKQVMGSPPSTDPVPTLTATLFHR